MNFDCQIRKQLSNLSAGFCVVFGTQEYINHQKYDNRKPLF